MYILVFSYGKSATVSTKGNTFLTVSVHNRIKADIFSLNFHIRYKVNSMYDSVDIIINYPVA